MKFELTLIIICVGPYNTHYLTIISMSIDILLIHIMIIVLTHRVSSIPIDQGLQIKYMTKQNKYLPTKKVNVGIVNLKSTINKIYL